MLPGTPCCQSPAALTSTSRPPIVATAAAIIASTEAASLAHRTATRSPAIRRSAGFGDRSRRPGAPASDSARTAAAPRPLAAPVTTTRRPCRGWLMTVTLGVPDQRCEPSNIRKVLCASPAQSCGSTAPASSSSVGIRRPVVGEQHHLREAHLAQLTAAGRRSPAACRSARRRADRNPVPEPLFGDPGDLVQCGVVGRDGQHGLHRHHDALPDHARWPRTASAARQLVLHLAQCVGGDVPHVGVAGHQRQGVLLAGPADDDRADAAVWTGPGLIGMSRTV